ncbi:hypothetical protein [[Muricauda] lutisoli]|uniref:Uncharacterized protein n=1 Tax=[Muricauda] lutisoli TaxID=2816035 RepID=A0ABS3EZ18_9FLAO|nr:hypothetical protein [[Muricauda] lutisoli]MBO0331136.1 hypothetical protein [[Muricauda] lutisoli]
MIKSIKRFLIKIARFCIKSFLWVIRMYRGRNDKSCTSKYSIQPKPFANKEGNKPKYLNEAHRKSEEAKGKYLASLNPSEIDWKKEKERQKINAIDDSPQKVHESSKKSKSEISLMSMSEHREWFNKEAARLEKEQYPPNDIEATQPHPFDYTKLTKKELDTLYHQIIDKALENYEYRFYVLFKWKINHEQFHYRAAASLATRIRREEQRMKKHDIIGAYLKKRWANMTPEGVEANREWIRDQGKLRNPN